jgi:hypothetical protein
MNLTNDVLEAVVLLSSDLDEEAVVDRLIRDGCSRTRAWKLRVLVPMAFARVAFEPSGVRFPAFFQVAKPGAGATGLKQKRRRLSTEPAFLAAVRLARRLSAAGRIEAFYRVVHRSAEYGSIQHRYRQGIPLREIHLAVPDTVLAG